MKILKWVYCWKDSRLQQNCKGLKILTPKQMIQRLPISLHKLKQVIYFKIYQMKSDKSYILGIEENRLIKTYATL